MTTASIGTVGVAGAGLMGSGIALNFALAGYETIMCDLNEGVLADAKKRIEGALAMFVEEGLTSSADAGAAIARIAAITDMDGLARRSFVIWTKPALPTRSSSATPLRSN